MPGNMDALLGDPKPPFARRLYVDVGDSRGEGARHYSCEHGPCGHGEGARHSQESSAAERWPQHLFRRPSHSMGEFV